jgi:hypothetical protein
LDILPYDINGDDLGGSFISYFGQSALFSLLELCNDSFFIATIDKSGLQTPHRLSLYHSKQLVHWYANQVSPIYTDLLNLKIKSAFPDTKDSLLPCCSLTWSTDTGLFDYSLGVNTNNTLYQVVFCTNLTANTTFMIVSYAQLALPPDRPSFFVDSESQVNTFQASTTDSNCGVPGQFIFQLNTIYQQNCYYFLIILIYKSLFRITQQAFFLFKKKS